MKTLLLIFVLVGPGFRHLVSFTTNPIEACTTYLRVAPVILKPIPISQLPVIIVAWNSDGKFPDICKGIPILQGEALHWGEIENTDVPKEKVKANVEKLDSIVHGNWEVR